MRRWVIALAVPFVISAGVAQAALHSDGSIVAPAQVTRLVMNVPVRTLNEVGAGHVFKPASGLNTFNVIKLGKVHLARHGKPELLSLTFAWCPHCEANSWAMVIALSRFGVLSGVRAIDSGTYYCKLTSDPCTLKPFPCYPHTRGLSFAHAKYSSRYLKFTDVILQDVHGRNLERPTRTENAAFNSFDKMGVAPALDVGGEFAFLNAGFSPGALAHKSWLQIAGSLADPHNPVAKRVDGLANLFTAAICKVTRGRPARVCKSTGVTAAARPLAHAAPPPPPPPPPPSQ